MELIELTVQSTVASSEKKASCSEDKKAAPACSEEEIFLKRYTSIYISFSALRSHIKTVLAVCVTFPKLQYSAECATSMVIFALGFQIYFLANKRLVRTVGYKV